MKKSARLLIGIASIFALAACSSDNGSNQAANENDATASSNGGSGSTLVVYFSYPVGTDLDVVTGASVLQNRGQYLGLVEQASIWISEELAADSFLIEPAEAYPDDVRQIIDEISADDAPDRELANTVRTIQDEIPEATVVTDALSVSRNDIESSQQEILGWLAETTADGSGG